MSLFTELYALTKARRFAMLVTSDHCAGHLTISVMPRPSDASEAPYCKDLTLTAPPEDFESGFIDALTTYRSRLLPLLDQVKATGVAIEKAAESAAQASAAKRTAKKSDVQAGDASGKATSPEASIGTKAREYLEASCGEDASEEEPGNDWMKNRQPELF